MFRLLLLALFSTLLWSNALTVSPKIVALDTSYFSVEANKSTFDTDLSYTHQRLLSCQPALDAVYKVDSDTKLRVIPKERLKSDINYHCNYHKLAFNITTEPFQVMDYHYFQGDKLLRITFNDHVDPEQAKTCITLKKKEKLASTNLNYTITQHNDTTLLLKINEPIAHQSIELTIDKTLSTPHGSHLAESFSASFNERYATVAKLDDQRKAMSIPEAPRMVALESGEFAIRLFLGDTLEGDAEKFIVIEGIDNFRLDKNNYLDYRMKHRNKIADNAYYYTDIISKEFQPNSAYNLTLKKGLRTYQELKEDQNYTNLKTADRAKGVIFDEERPYIANVGELGFQSINLDTATLIVERVLEDNLRYFMNFEGAKEKRVHHYTEEVLNQTLTLNNPKNEITQQKFSLKDIAKTLPHGVYKVTLRYTEGEEERSQSKVLFLSNLGLAVNLAKDQAFVTVLRLDTAKPVKGAKVTLYGKNNRIIGSAKTDKNGVATLNQTNLLAATPKGVVVNHGRDQNFLALNSTINTPTPETILKERERFNAHIYYQSQLVRPAGKIHALITIKDRDFISAPKLPVKLIFQERYGHALEEKVYRTDEFGLIDYTYQLDVEDRTGNYELLVKIGEHIIGRQGIKVEAFVPPKIENRITTQKASYRSGELIEANISSSYLFGAPAVGLRGTVTLDADTQAFEHPEYQGYSFTNHTLKQRNTQIYLEQREEITLNEAGKLNIALPTTLTQRVPSILDALIGVTIMDDTTPVSAYKNVTIYPYEAMVGIKLNRPEIKKGEQLKGTAVLIDPETGKQLDRELYASIKKVEWHYSYSNGHYQWEEEMTTVDRFAIAANKSFSRTLNGNGNYLIEIEDRLGRHSASSDFSVWYESYSNIAPNNTLKSVEITFQDKHYKKGDTLEATIKSPILKGELFVTLESDRVLTYQHHTIEKGVAKIELPIDEAIDHGAYLHATVYRASDTPSQLIPFRATGYHYIKPDCSAHQIDVKLDAPKETESKSTLNLGIQTDKEAKLLISVVDTGILQLAQQEKPTLFEYFNQQADKQLAYYDLYDQLTAYLTEGNLIAFGAGDMIAKRKKHLPPDLGDPVKPFMIWSGLFEAKKGGSTLGIDIPEFNGKATIVAIAINQNGLGVTTQDVMIKDDIMIKPSYPRYLLSGDTVDLPVRIFNTTKTDQDVTLESNVSANLVFDFPKSTITIPANSSELIPATLTAKALGKGKLSISGTVGGKLITKTIELPIYSPYALSTKTFKGMTQKPIT
ncbi:MAG TPA: hypothetical protein ENK86_03835, partial [Campylobacterales bacterium]|nr:hypothetical protein [Campylobacterales bacterium]